MQYVSFTATNTGADLGLQTGSMVLGTYTKMASATIEKTIIPWGYVFNAGNLLVYNTDEAQNVIAEYSLDPILDNTYRMTLTTAATVYLAQRNSIKNMIVHKFRCSGVNYVLTTTTTYDGGYYQINSMIKDWEKEETTLECFYCAAVA